MKWCLTAKGSRCYMGEVKIDAFEKKQMYRKNM